MNRLRQYLTRLRVMRLRSTVLLTIMLFVIPLEGRQNPIEPDDKDSDIIHPFAGRTINCVISTSNDMLSHTGLKAGFNYELLKKFAQQHDCPVTIRVAHSNEDFIDSLSEGAIDILVMETSDSLPLAGLRKSRNVDEYCAWFLGENAKDKLQDVNLWLCSYVGSKEYKELHSRFFVEYDPRSRVRRGVTSSKVSPYDDLIKQYSLTLGWDWRLLAAQIYHESRYSINSVSSRGATGLMQIVPSTAGYYGVTDLVDPEQSLIAGTKHLARIQQNFSSDKFTAKEKINFTLAAYNAGEGRIEDCMMIAAHNDLDTTKWEEIVKIIPDMSEYTIYAADSTVVRDGRFRGEETINYVDSVLELYEMICEICPED